MRTSELPEITNLARDVRVEIDATEARFIVLVVTAQPQCQRAPAPDHTLKVLDQRPPNALPSMQFRDHERMKFPNHTAVHRDAANPAEHPSGSVESDSADSVWRERCEHFLPCGVEILPVLSSVSKHVSKKHGCLLDEIRGVYLQRDDAKIHLAQRWDSKANRLATSCVVQADWFGFLARNNAFRLQIKLDGLRPPASLGSTRKQFFG